MAARIGDRQLECGICLFGSLYPHGQWRELIVEREPACIAIENKFGIDILRHPFGLRPGRDHSCFFVAREDEVKIA